MKMNLPKTLAIIFLMAIGFLTNYCQHKMTIQPNGPCVDNKLAEDTARVYRRVPIDGGGTLQIYPKMIFARFFPSVKDTAKIMPLLEKHHLWVFRRFGNLQQQLVAWLCTTDGRRAEYHFTPYNKDGFCNFGADSLVEYSFGVFSNGSLTPNGNILFKFVASTPQTKIDSLFNENGLRLLYTAPDIPSGKLYMTLVTPRSKKNILDLAYELQFVPYIIYASAGMEIGGPSARCE